MNEPIDWAQIDRTLIRNFPLTLEAIDNLTIPEIDFYLEALQDKKNSEECTIPLLSPQVQQAFAYNRLSPEQKFHLAELLYG